LRLFFNNPMAILLILLLASQSLFNGEFSNPMDWLMNKLILLPGILIGLSFHEFAHAKVANMLGDDTPRLQGRVTINPAAHIDPMGIIALLFIGFGWGKPVQVNPMNFKNMRRDGLLVDLAGVTLNFILAVLFAGILWLLAAFQGEFLYTYMGDVVAQIILSIISINIVLMVFNLLPIPPLDGFGIVTEIFDLRKKEIYYRIYDKGFLILMILILFNITGRVLTPLVGIVFDFVMGIFF
jgi:Zn-dependent protease